MNDERVKEYTVINYDVDPSMYELGDSQTETKIECKIEFGRRDNAESDLGTEKELFDTWRFRYGRYLRSRQFRDFLAVNGVKWMKCTPNKADPMDVDHPGLRKSYITLLIYTYIETLEDIPT